LTIIYLIDCHQEELVAQLAPLGVTLAAGAGGKLEENLVTQPSRRGGGWMDNWRLQCVLRVRVEIMGLIIIRTTEISLRF
jgi:hypothetical protein